MRFIFSIVHPLTLKNVCYNNLEIILLKVKYKSFYENVKVLELFKKLYIILKNGLRTDIAKIINRKI